MAYSMVLSVKSLDLFEEVICDRIYDDYDPQLQFYSISDAQSYLLSPSKGQSKLLGKLNSSLIGLTLEQFPHFPYIVQRGPLDEGGGEELVEGAFLGEGISSFFCAGLSND